jgi:hypothetical protein
VGRRDGTGRDGVFLSLSFPYSKDGEGWQELVTYALELGRRYREVHDVDRHACQEVAFFIFQSEAEQDRTHTHNGHDEGLRCRFWEESQARMETMN